MSEEKIKYWLEIFNGNKQAFMSRDGEIIVFCEVFKQLDLYKSVIDEITELVTNYEELEKILGAGKPRFELYKLQKIIHKVKESE